MLSFMRQNANSWVMILLFAIIIFVFAINFGPWAGQQVEGVHYAAMVNQNPISMAEFRTAYASQFARIKQFRPDYEESQADRDGLRQLVLEQLISRELLTQLGRSHHLTIGARTLAEEIKERVFGPDADFNKEEYIRRVNGFFQTTVSQFEEQVEKELIAQQMADLLGTPIYVSEQEAKTGFIDRNTKIAVEFVKVNPEFFKSKAPVSLAEVTAYTEKNPARIAEYYNEHLSKFNQPKKVRASHILVKFPSQQPSVEEKAKLKEKAQHILDRIKKGEDFAKIAKSESDDMATRALGGDLDFFAAGQMVEEFSNAAFALNLDEVSDIVETPFGFHIIKVTDKMDEQKLTLAQANNEIAETLVKEEAQKAKAKALANEALAQLKAGRPLDKINVPGLVRNKSDGLAPIADETNEFNRTSSYVLKIGRADTFVEQSFKLEKSSKTASEVFESDGQFFAIRIKSRQDADMSKFESEKESIRNGLLYPRKRAFMQQYLASLKAKAKISYNQALIKEGEIQL